MKNNKTIIAIGIILGLLLFGGVFTAFSINNKNLKATAQNPNPQEIQENYTSNEVWGKIYPTHWESYRKGLQTDSKTKYGGNVRESKLEIYPAKDFICWAGLFGRILGAQGHPYAVDDINSVPGSRKNRWCLLHL